MSFCLNRESIPKRKDNSRCFVCECHLRQQDKEAKTKKGGPPYGFTVGVSETMKHQGVRLKANSKSTGRCSPLEKARTKVERALKESTRFEEVMSLVDHYVEQKVAAATLQVKASMSEELNNSLRAGRAREAKLGRTSRDAAPETSTTYPSAYLSRR